MDGRCHPCCAHALYKYLKSLCELREIKWTGHSDYKAMKPYIDIAEKTKANAMAIFEMGLKK